MIRISQLRLPCGYEQGALENKIRKTIRLKDRPFSFNIVRHSVDARKKPQLFDMYTVDVDLGTGAKEEASLVRRLRNKNVTAAPADSYRFPSGGSEKLPHRPVVIGAGPAGLFCALFLAEHGYQPLVIERGRKMEDRTADVEKYWETGVLDTASNVQFGEGGAGTFSDGKLNTQINDRTGRSVQVLRTFVRAGAPESILYEGKPHIGTDRLRRVIPKIRERIEQAGGEVRFETLCTGFSFAGEEPALNPATNAEMDPQTNPATNPEMNAEMNPQTNPEMNAERSPEPNSGKGRRISGLYVRSLSSAEEGGQGDVEWIPAEAVVFAVGHSARDTIEELFREKIPLEQKQFAVGFRVAHPQALIDESQYGVSDPAELARMRLSASPYKLTAKASSGRGVYSFCMCPGGYIVNASSEQGHVCVNGMSDQGRGSGWANSAIVITVGQKEFGSDHVLAGMDFQRRLEKRAWEMGKGAVPIQKYREFRESFEAQKSGSPEQEQAPQGETETAAETIVSEAVKGTCRRAALHRLLPADMTSDFIEGMDQFGRKIAGFDGPQALVAGIESRTSSPVRIPRGQDLQSVGVRGLYPCGEGAGYAGGIMSAAMDGIRIAEAIAGRFAPPV